MKQIILKRLSLVNFKGIRSLEIDFSRDITRVLGRNGTGKTTLFDAFTWVLFKKDSKNREQFDIKTLDENGKPLPRIPHEVTAVIDVNGEEITLMRQYTEKWVKPKGSPTEKFSCHESKRFYNGVPCNEIEWEAKIKAICPEGTFKLITSPFCFTSLKSDKQREELIRMAGGFSDNEVIAASGQRRDFIDLLAKLCGKSMEEYKRQVAAKKNLIKAEIKDLPGRIDERQRDVEAYKEINFEQCEQELGEKQKALAEIEKQLTQASSLIAQANKEKAITANQLFQAGEKLTKLEMAIRTKLNEQYYNIDKRRGEILMAINSLESRIALNKQALKEIETAIEEKAKQRAALLAEWKAINAETLIFGTNDFICPTCGQPLDPDNIEKKKAEMQANFNAQKEAKLNANKAKGMKCGKAVLSQLDENKNKIQAAIDTTLSEIDKLKTELENLPEAKKLSEEEMQKHFDANEECIATQKEIERLSDELDKATNTDIDTEELQEAKGVLNDAIAELKATLERKKYLQRNNERIKELQELLKSQSDALAQLEGIEFTIAEFGKTRITALETKINNLFSIVKFKMFDQQVNGEEVETCEAMVNGVPYSVLNDAGRINAGLDIINAICRHNGITAPIFIDNAESVLEPMQTIGQQIRLTVANQDLTIY